MRTLPWLRDAASHVEAASHVREPREDRDVDPPWRRGQTLPAMLSARRMHPPQPIRRAAKFSEGAPPRARPKISEGAGRVCTLTVKAVASPEVGATKLLAGEEACFRPTSVIGPSRRWRCRSHGRPGVSSVAVPYVENPRTALAGRSGERRRLGAMDDALQLGERVDVIPPREVGVDRHVRRRVGTRGLTRPVHDPAQHAHIFRTAERCR